VYDIRSNKEAYSTYHGFNTLHNINLGQDNLVVYGTKFDHKILQKYDLRKFDPINLIEIQRNYNTILSRGKGSSNNNKLAIKLQKSVQIWDLSNDCAIETILVNDSIDSIRLNSLSVSVGTGRAIKSLLLNNATGHFVRVKCITLCSKLNNRRSTNTTSAYFGNNFYIDNMESKPILYYY